MKLFSRTGRQAEAGKPIIIVSGLPRSGTSMMMRMLAEGGLPVITDEIRRPDEDNPNGYFELEIVRQLREGDSEWLKGANGKGVKVISSLLEFLPPSHRYKIIFMERDTRETLVSQKKMLEHRGEQARISDEEMEQQFHHHLTAIRPWLVRQPNMEVLYVKYNALLAEPGRFCDQIAGFLEMPLDRQRMLTVPNTQLYRNRTGGQ